MVTRNIRVAESASSVGAAIGLSHATNDAHLVRLVCLCVLKGGEGGRCRFEGGGRLTVDAKELPVIHTLHRC